MAWVGDLTEPGLADALTTWFGAPTAAAAQSTALGTPPSSSLNADADITVENIG